MNIEIFKGNWSVEDVKSEPDKIFIFGDNNARIGKGGQAIIRDLPNAMGIRTKKGPSKKAVAYYKDSQFKDNANKILQDILDIKEEAIKGSTIVLASGGYGTGLASLRDKSPKTFIYLCRLLKEHFNFDNETGKSWYKAPGHNEISNGRTLTLDKNDKILQPINNSYFRDEYLEEGLNSTYDLIEKGKKVAFTSGKKYKGGDVLIFEYKEKITLRMSTLDVKKRIVCRVIESYDCSNISDISWSIFEGFNVKFIKSVEKKGYQTHFQFICTLDDQGNMVFNNDIFNKKKDFSSNEVEEVENKTEEIKNYDNVKVIYNDEKESKEMSEAKKISNEDLYKVLKSIESKLERKKWFSFKKKSTEDIIKSKINGNVLEIKKIDAPTKPNYQVKVGTESEFIYHLVSVKSGLFRKKVEIILSGVKPFDGSLVH